MNPLAILNNYDKARDVFVLVRSVKDTVPYTKKDGSPGYYQPLVRLDQTAPFEKHGYVFETAVKNFRVAGKMVGSASDIRAMYAEADEAGKLKIIYDLYPNASDPQAVKKILDKYLGAVQLAEADLPPDASPNSPIPGTPTSLQPKPSKRELLKHKRQLAAIKRLIGH
jgi:hypothetical protein